MNSALELSFSEDQNAIRAAIDRFCTQHSVEELARAPDAPFPRELWLQLAQLGVFAAAAPGHPESGGALEVCAITERLGHHVFPGPIAATFLAIQVLNGDTAAAVMDGHSLVSLSSAGNTLLPWAMEAQVFLAVENDTVASASIPQKIEPVMTLGGELWGRASLSLEKPLAGATRGLMLANIATAAYLTGAAWHLIAATSDYAATRKQFGKSLGEFQAVAHPLADAAIDATAAQTLTRAAACYYDDSQSNDDAKLQRAEHYAAGALVSARRASLQAAFTCHQIFGGIGITLDGPAFHISRRIRQLASTPPAGIREQGLLLASAGLGE